MPLMVCPKCTRFHYVPGDCPQPRSTGAKSAVTPAQDKPAQRAQGPDISKVKIATAHLAPKKRGRPKLHADRKSYKALKERERRARLKTAT
jgi:hypothetical protein